MLEVLVQVGPCYRTLYIIEVRKHFDISVSQYWPSWLWAPLPYSRIVTSQPIVTAKTAAARWLAGAVPSERTLPIWDCWRRNKWDTIRNWCFHSDPDTVHHNIMTEKDIIFHHGIIPERPCNEAGMDSHYLNSRTSLTSRNKNTITQTTIPSSA